jgi:microcystin-dependent protein
MITNGYTVDANDFITASSGTASAAKGVKLNSYGVLDPSFMPTGFLAPYAGSSTPPSGWLACDGSAQSRTTYAALFGIVGTTFGAGDGSTTFNLPDLRSRVPVGAGSGTKVATISSISGNIITATGLTNAANNEYQTGQAIVFSATVAGNLTNAATYYVIRVTNTTFSVATSLANAQAGTAVTLAGTETGHFTLSLTTRTLGDTGGEENHSLAAGENAAHTHPNVVGSGGGSNNGPSSVTNTFSGSTGSQGSNTPHQTMMPFAVLNWIIKY